MIVGHLLRVALENLRLRRGRTALLVLGVVVGVASLAFLLGVYRGLDGLVRRNLAEHRAVLNQRAALTARQEALVGSLPLARLVVRARSGNVQEADLARWRQYSGVERAEAVGFLFPIVLGVTPLGLEIPGVREEDLRREAKFPTSLYGVPPGYLGEEGLLPGASFPESVREGDPVPVVLPAAFLDFLSSLSGDDMVERSAEIVYARLERRFARRPHEREELVGRLSKLPGVGSITDAVIKKVIREGMREFLARVSPESLPQSFELALYPGLEEEVAERIPLVVVGYSRKIPAQGVAVSLGALQAWNRRFHEQTSGGGLASLFSTEPETAYAEVVVHTAGFRASVRLRDRLQAEGFQVESSLDEALAVERELEGLTEEAERIAGEAQRVDDLSGALGRGAAVISALLFLLAGAVIANGLTLSVLEQERRIGIFRAVGATRVAVLGIFLIEAAAVGVLGSSVGCAVAAGALELAAPHLTPAGLADPGALFRLSPAAWLGVAALGAGVSLAAGILPALRAASVQPVDVLKH